MEVGQANQLRAEGNGVMGDVVSYIDLRRPSQRGRCGSSGFLPHPPEPEQSLAVMTDRRGECDDPAAASGLLHTLCARPRCADAGSCGAARGAVAVCGGACRLQGKEKGWTTPHRRETIAARNRPAGVDGWEDPR